MPNFPGFVGGQAQNWNPVANNQLTINLFPEPTTGGKSELIMHAAPGKRVYTVLGDSPTRGCFAQDGRAFFAAGFTLYEVQNGTSSVLGSIAADDFDADFASNGTGANQLFIVSGGLGYIFSLTAGSLTPIGGGFPSHARGAAFRDGYFITTGRDAAGVVSVYASNLEDGLTWNALSKAQRSIASDQLATVVVDDHRIIWLIGTQTSEPWYDAGLTPFPFTPISGAFMSAGTGAVGSVERFDNSVIFLAQTENGDRMVMMAGPGYSAQRISTHEIEAAWALIPDVSQARLWTYEEMGHTFAVFTIHQNFPSYVYDAATQLWHLRGKWQGPTSTGYLADLGRCHCYAFGEHLVGSRIDGTIYAQSMALYSEAGAVKRWLRRFAFPSASNDWAFFDGFELLMLTGQGLATGQGSDPQVMLRLSKDGGQTFGTELSVTSGAQGAYGTRVYWTRLGRSRARQLVFEVSGSDPVKTSLIDADISVRQGRP